MGCVMLNKVYSYGYYEVTDKETVEMLLVSFEAFQCIRKKCDKEFYSKFIIKQHELLRIAMGLPNEVFGFYPNEDKTKIIIELYPLTTSEKHYEGGFDEEVGIPYILVDESE